MTINYPSIDPADNDSLVGTINFVVNKILKDQDDMLPAKVIAVKDGFVQVQPQIYLITTGGEQVSRAQFAKVPILSLGGGGFVLTFPVKAGDFGYIKANDRDISIFLQSLSESPPGTVRQHSFSDAVFIPNAFSGYSYDSDNLVLQKLDGSVKIELSDNAIDITAPTVNINGSQQVNVISSDSVEVQGTGQVNIDSSTQVKLTAPIVNVNGTIF
jgi:hypothetical protein